VPVVSHLIPEVHVHLVAAGSGASFTKVIEQGFQAT
jgi:hypothetical protein